jgi:Fe-S-cluster containining protein
MNDLSDDKKSELCLKCLKCCTYIAVPSIIDSNNAFVVNFYKTRGCKTFVHKNILMIVIEYKCPHLTENGCSIYDKRPIICKNYDGRLDETIKVMGDICLWEKENG